MHFGMSGHLNYFKDMDDEPEYDQVLFSFENGYHLAYVAPRKLGEIRLLDRVQPFIEEKDLGPDVMAEDFETATLRALFADRRGMVKSALMDQSLMAGIGNVYSDEILFQVGLHPRTKVKALSKKDVERLYDTMQEVLQTAIDRQADPDDYPEGYLTPHRGPDGACPCCGEPLVRVKVAGRSAYVCTNRQGEHPEDPA
jgi:formamidopyrimidine-DNA glycosylase